MTAHASLQRDSISIRLAPPLSLSLLLLRLSVGFSACTGPSAPAFSVLLHLSVTAGVAEVTA